MSRLSRWRHRRRGHMITTSRMTPVTGDTGSNLWHRCSCGKDWLG